MNYIISMESRNKKIQLKGINIAHQVWLDSFEPPFSGGVSVA